MDKFFGVSRDDSGDLVSGATVTVYLAGTSTPATLYSDRAGASALANPLYSGSDGGFAFHAVDGAYDIKVDDGTSTRWAYGVVLSDPFPYNVTNYGAKGDGSTDDTAAIQAAVDACAAASGGVVLMPAGRYVVDTIAVPWFVTLRGQSAGSIGENYDSDYSQGTWLIPAPTSTAPVVDVYSDTDAVIGVRLEHFGIAANTGLQTKIGIRICGRDIHAVGIIVERQTGPGVQVRGHATLNKGSVHVSFTNSKIWRNQQDDVAGDANLEVYSVSNNQEVTEFRLINCEVAGDSTLTNGKTIRIHGAGNGDCVCIGTLITPGNVQDKGIYLEGSANHDLCLVGSVVDGGAGTNRHITLDATASIDRITVAGSYLDCVVDDNGTHYEGDYFNCAGLSWHFNQGVYRPASAPATPEEGMVYYDSAAKKLKVYTGAAWETITSA